MNETQRKNNQSRPRGGTKVKSDEWNGEAKKSAKIIEKEQQKLCYIQNRLRQASSLIDPTDGYSVLQANNRMSTQICCQACSGNFGRWNGFTPAESKHEVRNNGIYDESGAGYMVPRCARLCKFLPRHFKAFRTIGIIGKQMNI